MTGGRDLLFGPGPKVGLFDDELEDEVVVEAEEEVEVVEAG